LLLLIKRELKAYTRMFWLSSKSETWNDIQYLYKRNNIIFIFYIYYYYFFRELKPMKNHIFNYQDKNKGKEKG